MLTETTSHTFPGDATAPAGVRLLLQRQLEACGHTSTISEAQLLASEVVTNAVIHTQCDECKVDISIDDTRIRIAVTDCDAHSIPFLTSPDPSRFGGLGLHIVNDVARCWGWELNGHGKTVWFELTCTAPDAEAADAEAADAEADDTANVTA